MTENEAKYILNEIMELDDSMAQYSLTYMKAMEVAIKALEEVQQYRTYKEKFKEIYGDCENALEVLLNLLLEYEIKEAKGSYIIRLLTDDDAKKRDEYRALGTPEELKSLKENGAFTGMELAQLATAMQRLREYERIGTPEECRAAVEKQTVIPREIIEGKYFCPKCHNLMPYPGYCGCGQRLY